MTDITERRGDALLDWFIRSDFFEGWRSDHLSALGYGSTDAQERYDRIWSAAEHGADGSTHGEIIEDWREAWSDFLRSRNGLSDLDRVDAAITASMDRCEQWHAENKSLDQQVG